MKYDVSVNILVKYYESDIISDVFTQKVRMVN